MAPKTIPDSKKVKKVKGGDAGKTKVVKKKKKAIKVAKTVKAVVMTKSKIVTYAEVKFTCPTADCKAELPRYCDMFKHFIRFCRPSANNANFANSANDVPNV